MEILYDITKQNDPCCVALGFFDGVHKGHQTLLRAMKKYADEHALTPCVFTFSTSPCAALGKAESRALNTFEERMNAIGEYSGARCCCAVDFAKYKDVPAESFVEDILIGKLGARAVFCGFNFHFGKKAAGDAELLTSLCAKHGVSVFVTQPVCADGDTVSSTRIRRLIETGAMHEANTMLAHPFCIEGVILHGKENGRTVGIPTINQALPEGFVIPRFGVYASCVTVDGTRRRAITNVGIRPTVTGEDAPRTASDINCETHILDGLDEELYGKNVRTELLWFERDERKFRDLNELAEQIRRDIAHINTLDIYDNTDRGL